MWNIVIGRDRERDEYHAAASIR